MTRILKCFALLTFLILVAGVGIAQTAETSPAAADATPEDSSAAAPEPLVRDPFWPVGWKPEPVSAGAAVGPARNAVTKWDEARNKIQLSGLSKNVRGDFVAILKGVGIVEAGDVVSVQHDGLFYKWKIKDITSKGIVPIREGVFLKK